MDAITIETKQDIAAFAKDVRTGHRRKASSIKVNLKELDASRNDELTQQINRHYFACGCSEATALALAALAAAAAWTVSNLDSWRDFGWQNGLIIAGSFVAASGVGKAIGRWRARRALQSALDALMSCAPDAGDIGKGDGSAVCSVGK